MGKRCVEDSAKKAKGQIVPVECGAAITGCRIPQDYFTTAGEGESDITVHAGSYHLALKDAGIEMCNIMTYSSIMPKEAREVRRPRLVHGSVMETIMAVATSKRGERATAGIIYGWLYDKRTGERFGGLVCEYDGDYTIEEVRRKLKASIDELYTNGFSRKYDLKCIKMLTKSFTPKKAYGTALVAICFTSYIYPPVK
jgi:arginine decarboxylase